MGSVTDDEGGPSALATSACAGCPRWQAAFPYHWDTDDLVTRRELLRFAVYTSGALFAGAVALAGIGALGGRSDAPVLPLLRVSELPEGRAHYFHYPEADDEAVLLHLPGAGFVAFSQRCTHLSCAVVYQAERERLYCPCHEGVFDLRTGDPIAGPPRRRLPRILLRREGDLLYAVGVQV